MWTFIFRGCEKLVMTGIVLLLLVSLLTICGADGVATTTPFRTCGKTKFTGLSGTINTYNRYNSSGSCTYTIETPSFMRLKLTWRKFDVDGDMPLCSSGDSISIKIGCNYPRKIAEFCSNNMKTLPHEIYSPDNCISLTYSKYKNGGFIADYTAVNKRTMLESSCRRTKYITQLPAIITSPGWPFQTRLSSCEWKIRLSDKGKKIVINIMDMNGFSYKSASYLCPFKNYLKIKGKKSLTTKSQKSWYFCRTPSSGGTTYTHSASTKYYEMDIKLAVSTRYLSSPARGFIIGVVAYEDELAKSLSSWTSIIVGVATVLIILMLAVCCYRRYRRRRLMEQQPMIVPGTVIQTGQPVQPAGYPTQPYAATVPPAYHDQPPPYQPPPYDTGKGSGPTPYPSYQQPAPGYLPYSQQNPIAAPYPQQNPTAAPYPQQNPVATPYVQHNPSMPYPQNNQGNLSSYPPQYPPQ